MITLQVAAVAVMERAQATLEKLGQVYPCMWAIGPEEALFAVPASAEGLQLNVLQKLGLHAVIAHSVNADFVGRTNEVWTRMGDPDEVLLQGALAAEVDTNPDVQTALMVQAMTVETNRHLQLMSRLALSDEGAVLWKNSDAQPLHAEMFKSLKAVCLAANDCVRDDAFAQMSTPAGEGLMHPEYVDVAAQKHGWVAIRVEL